MLDCLSLTELRIEETPDFPSRNSELRGVFFFFLAKDWKFSVTSLHKCSIRTITIPLKASSPEAADWSAAVMPLLTSSTGSSNSNSGKFCPCISKEKTNTRNLQR